MSGYSSGTWGLNSDHRMLWVDIDAYSTFGGVSAPIWRPRIRRLKLEDPTIVKKFNNLRRNHMELHNLAAIKDEIEQYRRMQPDNDVTWQYLIERLDRLRVQGILEADRRCRKLRCGNIPWSPAVQKCMDSIGYLQACRKKFIFHKQIHSRTLMKLFKKSGLDSPVLSGNDAIIQLREKYNELNLLKVKASVLRGNFLLDLSERKAAEGNGKAETILKQLILREEQRAVARATKRVLNKFRGGVTAIEAKNSQGEWCIYTDKHKIEQGCIKENIARFTQASHLPVMQQSTIRSVGWFAETGTSQNILQGNFDEGDQ